MISDSSIAPSVSPDLHQMMQIGARIVARRRPCAFLVERPRIVGVAGVAQIDLAEAGERHAVAPVAGRHHAVEHVDAARHRLQQILGRADAHQVARAIRRQRRRGLLDHREHHRLRLADRKPADRVAVKADLDQRRAR